MVQEWVRAFKDGRMNVHDQEEDELKTFLKILCGKLVKR